MDEIKKAQRETLGKIEKMLAQVVGVQKMAHMDMGDFVKYAFTEIGKAAEEDAKGELKKSHVRLALLYKSVMYSSAVIESTEADGLKVPVFICDQTSIDEQANEIHTPAESLKMNPSGGTVFEGGFVAKMMDQIKELSTAIDKLAADEPPPSSETMKAKGAFPGAAPPFGKEPEKEKAKKDAADGDPTEEEKKKKAEEEEKAKGTKKSDAVWPEDMNDPNFVQKGQPSATDWGND